MKSLVYCMGNKDMNRRLGISWLWNYWIVLLRSLILNYSMVSLILKLLLDMDLAITYGIVSSKIYEK